MDKLPESAGHFNEISDKIQERVLLNHEFKKLKEIAAFNGVRILEYLEIRKFPLINISYKGQSITMVTTHMGVDNTLWVTDALLYHGAKKFLKFGSFISLDPKIKRGDIYVPDWAIALPGPIEVYMDVEKAHKRVSAERSFVDHIQKEATSLHIKHLGRGTILTYPIIRVHTDHPEYSIEKWKDRCFGLEMECAAVFAVVNHFNSKEDDEKNKAQSAAILICNREGYQLGFYESSEKVSVTQREYDIEYTKAIELSLKVLTTNDL